MDSALGARLRALRTAAGLSLAQLASRTYTTRQHLSDVERGRRRPSPALVDALDAALHAGGQLVDAHAGRLAHAAAEPRRVDAATVDALADVLASLRRLEDVAGVTPAVAAVDAHWPLITSLADDARGPVRPAAVSLAGQWCQFRGWLATAQADTATAGRMWDRATEAATEVDNRDLTAVVLSFRGHAAWLRGQAGRALGATEAVLRDQTVCIDQRAYDWHQLARIRAALGEPADARDALARGRDLAAEALAEPGQRPPWHYYRTDAFWQLEAALVHAALGEADAAERAYRAGLDSLPPDQHAAEWLAEYRDRVSAAVS